MKTAAIVGDFPVIREEERKYIQRVKSLMKSERLIALISGDFLQPGIPASEDKYQRARKLCDAGVDLVFELPVYCGLNTQDTYAFTVMAFLEKLGCVEEVYLSCHLKKETAEQESPQELLKKVSMRMFMETPDYQKKLKALKNQGCNHFEAQARVVEAYIPGAEMILRDTENAWAAEYMKALKKMYSPIKPVLLQGTLHMDEVAEVTGEKEEYMSDQGIVEGHSKAFPEANGDNVGPERKLWDERLLRMLQERFRSLEPKKAMEWLNETFGGTTARSEILYDFFQSGEMGLCTYSQLVELITNERFTTADARRYLLRLLLGIRKLDNSICGLYSYALYARLLAMKEDADELLSHLKKTSWIPMVIDTYGDPRMAQGVEELEECRRIMAKIDVNAHVLYNELSGCR